MAKGDYTLFNNLPFQSVTSFGRRFGVMFNPGSSRSRLRIRDSGRRYGVRLRVDGTVEYSIDGDVNWKFITPLTDPCTNQQFPSFFSHENKRLGEALSNITFDMIAVGRGRIIGKETGTDRLFHLYIDEMFRSQFVHCNPGENSLPIDDADGDGVPNINDLKDVAVPPFNMKIDPEYFTEDPPSVIVPPAGTRNYFNHPASLRLPVFNQLLELDVSDVMLVLERARTWYLKDTRSQFAITAMEDFAVSDQDLAAVFTEEALHDILQSLKDAAGEMSDNWFANLILGPLFDVDQTAINWHAQIVAQGSGVMIFGAYAALGALIYLLGNSGAIATTPERKLLINPRKLLDFLATPLAKPKAQEHLDEAIGRLMGLISDLMLRGRRAAVQRYGARTDVNRPNELPAEWTLENRMPTANQPPSWMPVTARTTYMQRKGAGKGAWRKFYTGNEEAKKVWLATNADGSLEAFSQGAFDQIFHTSQGKPNGNWDNGSWTPLFTGNDKVQKLTYTRNIDGRLEVLRIDGDHHLFHTTQAAPNDGNFGAWKQLLGSGDKRISVAVEANLDGRLELFAVAEDKHVWRTNQTTPGNWPTTWVAAFGPNDKLRDVWMARNADGRLEAFGLADDNTIWHTQQTSPGTWGTQWDPLFSSSDHLDTLVIGRNADGRLEVIGISDVDHSIWRTVQASPGNWSGSQWNQLFATALTNLWVTTNAQGWLQLFGVSSNNKVWHAWQTAANGNFDSSLHEIKALKGRVWLGVAPNVDGSIEIVGSTPWQNPFDPEHPRRMRLLADKRFAIQYSHVLDIAIGSSHWNENWQTHFGGEIHALLAPRPLFQGERYSLMQYRFLNGPVIDGDAFNDGTTNFYMLVKLGPPGSAGAGFLQRYAILWFDEQTYFTQRWRLLHPTDDILGDLFSLPHYIRDNPEWYDFHLKNYWDPFRANLINDDSRMVLRRNVIVVTGKDQQRHEIYTIVFNYGLCDHSWRWRLFPPGQHVLVDRTAAQDQNPPLPADVTGGSASAYVAVNTIDIRDDTMLHVRGSQRSPVSQNLRVGRWIQRYLPADCRHVPDRHDLTGSKPAAGFDHKWDFVSEAAYQRADRFYQFGVYEDLLDSRGQYYRVELLPSAGGTPGVQHVAGRVWKNDDTAAGEDRLQMNTINFNWALEKNADGAIVKTMQSDDPDDPELFVHEFRKRKSISMYERTTRFRLLERKPLGLIAVFYDKRDDELQAASNLPQPTTLSHDDVETTEILDAWKIADGETIPPALPPPAFPNIRVRFKSNHRVYQPPNVRKAQVIIDPAPGLRLLHVTFWTPQTEQEVCENIWKVSLAAIDQNGAVFPIFSVNRFGSFVRRAVPDAPLPPNFTGDLGDAWRYDFDFPFTKDTETNVRRFCTSEGHIEFGTSLWFEDIVGHRALAEQLIFA